MNQKLTRYSPGGYGAMCEDDRGDYVRVSEIEPLVQKAVDHAKDSGILAGSIIADENAEELAKARDLMRWRKAGEEMPEVGIPVLCCNPYSRRPFVARLAAGQFIGEAPGVHVGVTHWRPIGPMPEGGK